MVDLAPLAQHLESTNDNGITQSQNQDPTPAESLLQRCHLLISELETFKDHLKAKKIDHTIEIAHFRNTVKSELRTLSRLAQNERSEEATQHTVNSSNLPFLETVWVAVKNSSGLQALQKRFYWHGGLSKERAARQAVSGRRNGDAVRIPDKRKESALVDVVSRDGMEWTKVSLITNTRLLFDKAKQGWEEVSSSEDEEEAEENKESEHGGGRTRAAKEDDPENDIPLIRMAKDLLKAARTVRIRTNHPRIRLVLPKIEEGNIDAIDDILSKLRNMGCVVETSADVPPTPPLEDVIDNLLTDSFASLSETVNIDCTILLALVSDFSHCSVDAEPWFHRALKRQVEIEDKENLLPNLLYPAIAGRRLECTREAAKRMHEIVDTIGTPGEKARTKLFMQPYEADAAGTDESIDEENLTHELQQWSKFEVPPTLHLPIRVVESGVQITFEPAQANESAESLSADEIEGAASTTTSTSVLAGNDDADDVDDDPILRTLPPAARHVKKSLTWINQSVFLHGWSAGHSTITSNRTVVKQIENILDKHADSEKDWPNIWLCPTARSLVGKEKERKE